MRLRIAILTCSLPCLWDASWAQSDWTTRVDSVPGVIHDMHWTGGLVLAVDERGAILTSPQGVAWTTVDSGGPPFQSVIRTGNGRYLASSLFGQQALSEDGLHWTRTTNAESIRIVAALGTKTLGTDGSVDSGNLYLSLNDSTWKRVGAESQGAFPVRDQVSRLASNGRMVVAIGTHRVEGDPGSESGLTAVSTDGEKWSFRQTQVFYNAFRVRWAKDRFFALHLNVLASSFDGLAWSPAAYLPQSAFPLDVTWTGSQFISVGASGLILASDDGAVWQEVHGPFGDPVLFSSVVWTGSRLVLAGSRNSYRFIVTTDRSTLATKPGRSARSPLPHWDMEGGWLIGRLPADGKAGRSRVFDARGFLVRDLPYAAGAAQARIPLSGLGRGIYILQTGEGGTRVSSPVPFVR